MSDSQCNVTLSPQDDKLLVVIHILGLCSTR